MAGCSHSPRNGFLHVVGVYKDVVTAFWPYEITCTNLNLEVEMPCQGLITCPTPM